jgi:hypothetical protein
MQDTTASQKTGSARTVVAFMMARVLVKDAILRDHTFGGGIRKLNKALHKSNVSYNSCGAMFP